MSNKYLIDRLEECKLNPRIEHLIFMVMESTRDGNYSDSFEEFLNIGVEKILETLGWKKSKEVIEEVI